LYMHPEFAQDWVHITSPRDAHAAFAWPKVIGVM
jgi:hypothetical protein